MSVRPLRILIAEDNDLFREALGLSLENCGHQVTLRSNGLRTLRTLKERPFDLVILDVKMPEMSGLEVLEAAQQQAIRVPAIVISSQSYHLPPGIRFLQKPFSLSDLKCVVDQVVGLKSPTQ